MKLNKIFLTSLISNNYCFAHGWDNIEPSEYYNQNNLPDMSLGFISTSFIVLIIFLSSIYLGKRLKLLNKLVMLFLLIYLFFISNYSGLEVILMSFALFLFFGLLLMILFCFYILVSLLIKIFIKMSNNLIKIYNKST